MQAFSNSGKQATLVQISRYNDSLIVDGAAYQFISNQTESFFGAIKKKVETKTCESLTSRTTALIELLQSRINEVKESENLFLSKEDYRLIVRYAEKLEKRLNVILSNAKTL